MQGKWFHRWFNSPYYHILYQQRNDEEAEFFLNNLINYLKPVANAKILDIACGKGRHSIYLNKKGFDVIGIDLSERSILHAKQFENSSLHFFKHDMRQLFYINYFDVAINLFTSFGYFDSEYEHVKALKSFRKTLKNNGCLVLDYFNTTNISNHLNKHEIKSVNGIDFEIRKTLSDGKIIKDIQFEAAGKTHHFEEKVHAFKLVDFKRMLLAAGMYLEHTFGDYKLNDFDESTSERLILICRKV